MALMAMGPTQSLGAEVLESSRGEIRSFTPNWLRNFGGPFAALCAALTGIVPFFGVAVLALVMQDAGSFSGAPEVGLPSGGSQLEVTDFEGLWKELQRQEASRSSLDAAIAERMQRLEQAAKTSPDAALALSAAEKAVAAASAAEASAASAAAAASGSGAGQGDATVGLGVDWAAWGAGAFIDHGHSSGALGRHFTGRLGRLAASFLPQYRELFAAPHPPEVLLAWDSAPPSRCHSMVAAGGTVAIRFPQAVRASHVVIEQTPLWASSWPSRASPRHFQVQAWPADVEIPYSVELGAFEYQLHGQRLQVFALTDTNGKAVSGRVQGIRFIFDDNWGEASLTVCRLRVFGEL